MKKDLAIIVGLFVLIAALLIFGRGFTSVSLIGSGASSEQTVSKKGKVQLSVKTLNLDVTVAQSSSLRQKGLSKREFLPLTEGMLFVFEKTGRYSFWMKDMKFAIDIIWIDEANKIVQITKNVPPEPRKKDSQLTVYKPDSEILYVLEINAGLSDFNNLEVGDTVNFTL